MRWKPSGSGGSIADKNNATDGDLLIAWGLARAAAGWGGDRYELWKRGSDDCAGGFHWFAARSASTPMLTTRLKRSAGANERLMKLALRNSHGD